MKERTQLERAALGAHRAGLSWSDFWPTIAQSVAALEPHYHARGRFVHKLVGLVAAGEMEGQEPIDAGYARPLDFELEAVR